MEIKRNIGGTKPAQEEQLRLLEPKKGAIAGYKVSEAGVGARHLNTLRNRTIGKVFDSYSKEFMVQALDEIAGDLADQELKTNNLDRETVKAKYKDQLKDAKSSVLLNINVKEYVDLELDRLTKEKQASIRSAISTLNEKYLSKGNAILGKDATDNFIHRFTNSRVFREKGLHKPDLNHRDIENMLIVYISFYSQQEPFSLKPYQSDAIKNAREAERKAIDDLVEAFRWSKTHPIQPEHTTEIIGLWQTLNKHMEDVAVKVEAVEEFINGAYDGANKAVRDAAKDNPIKAKETIEGYEKRLVAAVKNNLKTNPSYSYIERHACASATGRPMYEALRNAKKDIRQECCMEVNAMLQEVRREIKPAKGETIDTYLKKVSEKVRNNCEKVEQGTSRDEFMRKAANKVLQNFEIDQHTIDAYKTVSKEIEEGEDFKKFTPGEQEAFRIAFPRQVGRLSPLEQSTVHNVKTVASHIMELIQTKKYQKAQLSEQRKYELGAWLNNVIIEKFQDTLDSDSAEYCENKKINIDPSNPEKLVDLQSIIQRAFVSFVADKLGGYIAGEEVPEPDKAKMEEDFKKYLQEINAFRKMVDSMEKDLDEKAIKFLDKLVGFFNIFPKVEILMVYKDEEPTPVPVPQPSFLDSILKFIVGGFGGSAAPEQLNSLKISRKNEVEVKFAELRSELINSFSTIALERYQAGGENSMQSVIRRAFEQFATKNKQVQDYIADNTTQLKIDQFNNDFKKFLQTDVGYKKLKAQLMKEGLQTSTDHGRSASALANEMNAWLAGVKMTFPQAPQPPEILKQYISDFEKSILKNDETSFYNTRYFEEQVTIMEVLSKKYDSFIAIGDNQNNVNIEDAFKKYLKKDDAFNNLITIVGGFDSEEARSLSKKLKEYFLPKTAV